MSDPDEIHADHWPVENPAPKYWAKEAEGRPWIATDPDNPCHEWRATGRHCSRCPFDPVCNE